MGLSACIDHIIDLIEDATLKRNPARGLSALARGEGATPELASMPSADRLFEIVAGISADDDEAGVTHRRRSVSLSINVRYDLGVGGDEGTTRRRINEDLAALEDAIANPNLWDAGTGLDDVSPAQAEVSRVAGESGPLALILSVPARLRYYEV